MYIVYYLYSKTFSVVNFPTSAKSHTLSNHFSMHKNFGSTDNHIKQDLSISEHILYLMLSSHQLYLNTCTPFCFRIPCFYRVVSWLCSYHKHPHHYQIWVWAIEVRKLRLLLSSFFIPPPQIWQPSSNSVVVYFFPLFWNFFLFILFDFFTLSFGYCCHFFHLFYTS